MKLLLSTLFLCPFWLHVLFASEVSAATTLTLKGKGTVIEEQNIEQINVEGTASGYVTGTFVWKEQHRHQAGLGDTMEHGTITIEDEYGDTLVLKFSGKANMHESNGAAMESASGSFNYLEGTGRWAGRNPSGTYTKAGVFEGGSVELSITLTVESN